MVKFVQKPLQKNEIVYILFPDTQMQTLLHIYIYIYTSAFLFFTRFHSKQILKVTKNVDVLTTMPIYIVLLIFVFLFLTQFTEKLACMKDKVDDTQNFITDLHHCKKC